MKRIVTNDHEVIYISDESMYYLKARVGRYSTDNKPHYMIFNSLTDNFMGNLSKDDFYQLVSDEVTYAKLNGWRLDDEKVFNENNA